MANTAMASRHGARAEGRVERLAAMLCTSPARSESSVLLADLRRRSGAEGVALGWSDALAPERVVPVHAIAECREAPWDLGREDVFSVSLGAASGLTWWLAVRGADERGLMRVDDRIAEVVRRFAVPEHREAPRLPEEVRAGPCPRFIALLDAYRAIGFDIGLRAEIPSYRAELRGELPTLPPEARVPGAETAAAIGDPDALAAALPRLAEGLRAGGARPEAASVYVVAYELALRSCDASAGIDAARGAGRAYREMTDWAEAHRWYGVARRVAEHETDRRRWALALDGDGNTYRERGDYPSARSCYAAAWDHAVRSGQPDAIGAVGHSMMSVRRSAGDFAGAAEFGWLAFQAQADPEERANLLLNIGTLLRDGGDLACAEKAYVLARGFSTDATVRMMAADALAFCAVLTGSPAYADWRRVSRKESRGAPPYVRAQVGYFRGVALRIQGRRSQATRVLRAVERYARSAGLNEWEWNAGELADKPLPLPQPEPVVAPAELRQGLEALMEVGV